MKAAAKPSPKAEVFEALTEALKNLSGQFMPLQQNLRQGLLARTLVEYALERLALVQEVKRARAPKKAKLEP